MTQSLKKVIVMRADLKMRRGKENAQSAHTSDIFWINKLKPLGNGKYEVQLTPTEEAWVFKSEAGIRKACVQTKEEHEFYEILEAARKADLHVDLVKDSGLTEFGGVATHTCFAIGPQMDSIIDPITGHLSLR